MVSKYPHLQFISVLLMFLATGDVYHIYPQPHIIHVDMDFHVRNWIHYLEDHALGHSLSPDDYLFGTIGANGKIAMDHPISHDAIQKMITAFTTAANINLHFGSFTTHAFRQGGAQYRFMYAPPHQRWPLPVVCWWGGWAENEHVSPSQL